MTLSNKSHHHQGKVQEEGRSGGDGGQIEKKLCEVNTRAVSRGQHELIGEFKMVAGDVISIGRGISYEVHVHSNKN